MKRKYYTLIIRFKVSNKIKIVRYYSNVNREIVEQNKDYITKNPRCISACIIEERLKEPREFFRQKEKEMK